jgi:hypothetical protein
MDQQKPASPVEPLTAHAVGRTFVRNPMEEAHTMRKLSFASVICLYLLISTVPAALAQNQYEKYLTAADVEKITGIKGVNLIPRGSVAGAAGDLNFSDASGELILMVQFTDAKNYESFKNKYPKGAVSGVGNQAVQGALMPGMPDNLLVFTKGAHCIALTAFGDFIKKKVYLTTDQLIALGKLIASRLS